MYLWNARGISGNVCSLNGGRLNVVNGIRLTKAQQFWPLTDFLSGLGVPVGRYIERFRLSKKMLDAPDIFVDEARFWQLSGDLARREGFLDWGFRAGEQIDFSSLGEFGDVLTNQPTLKAALENFVRTIAGETQSTFSLMPGGDCTWLMMEGCSNAPAGRDVIELYDFKFLTKLVQCAAGNHWLPPAVHLVADALPAGLAEHEICTGNVRYASTMTALAIPNALLALPMNGYHSSAVPCCSTTGDHLLAEADFATSLRLLLGGYVDEILHIDECANLVGMSSRTLQRRLAANDTSFNNILEQTRFDAARQLLEQSSASILEIAYETGYSDPANFTRAFRRWAGMSPRQHRQQTVSQ